MNTQQTRFDTKSLLLGAALGAVVMFSVAATTTATRTTWEYRTVPGQVLGNELGQAINASVTEGWEFVSAASSTEQWGFAVMRREKK